jgi:tRNA (adenine37-N6)-methyltransferase
MPGVKTFATGVRLTDEMQSLELKPIGIIHSPYRSVGEPRCGEDNREVVSEIEVFHEFEQGLQDIDGFSHIVVIYWFHRSEGFSLLVKPPGEDSRHGLFATRSPHRPCPLGLTVVQLVARKKNVLKVRGLDATDGTPLLDIKPHIPSIPEEQQVKVGWLEGKLGRERC